jgi:hypothetical protein
MAVKKLDGAGVLYTDRRQFYLRPNVVQELWTDVAPFTTLISNRSIVTGLADPLFKLFEHRHPWVKQEFVVAGPSGATIANNDTGITCTVSGTPVGLPASTDPAYINLTGEIWDTTKTTKRGQIYISNNSAGTLTLKNLSTTSITGVVAGDIVVVTGNAQGEGSLSPKAWADELKVVWGSTQMFETPIEITGILYQASLRGYNKELERLRLQKNQEHKMQKERTFLFGGSVIGTGLADSRDGSSNESFSDTTRTDANGNAVRTTMGLITALEKYGISTTTNDDQNLFTINSATYKYSNFVDDMEKVFHYYPDGGVKYAFCAPGAMSYWSKMDGSAFMVGKSGWQVRIGDTQRDQLGFSIRMLETPHGMLALVPTPALRGPYNNRMVVVSDNNLSLVQYEPPQFKVNIKTDDGYKGEKDEYFSDEGIGMTLIESHKMFTIV